jgi:cell wall-associated NlpC family hydrolase
MRRMLLAVTTAGLATVGAGWLALGASGSDQPVQAKRLAAAAQPLQAKVSLPPLPASTRATAVEPVAGGEAPTPVVDEEVQEVTEVGVDVAPTRAASAARKTAGDAAGNGSAVTKAVALGNGVALPPLDAPEAVKQIIEAGNGIARTPYKWGGGHGKWQDTGYDCSGSVSFALAAAGLLSGPLASGPLMSWGEAGRGKWVTIWTNEGHVFLEVAGIRFDTSAQRVTGSRWINEMRSTDGFVARHPAGL